jgi:hypothetical protein
MPLPLSVAALISRLLPAARPIGLIQLPPAAGWPGGKNTFSARPLVTVTAIRKWVRNWAGYYEIDVQGMVAAFQHNVVFSLQDIDRLIATKRDFMWNRQISGAKFQRIDGGQPDPRWLNSPGMLWNALIPYDETLRKIFVANHRPDSWDGLGTTPWFLSLTARH